MFRWSSIPVPSARRAIVIYIAETIDSLVYLSIYLYLYMSLSLSLYLYYFKAAVVFACPTQVPVVLFPCAFGKEGDTSI